MALPGFRLVSLLTLVAAGAVTIGGAQQTTPWPPGVRAVPDISPPLAPADAIKSFTMAPGYRVELVASEPLIQDPVAIDWDVQGRLWAVEMPGYMRDVSGDNEH